MNKFEISFETEDFESMLSKSLDSSNFQEGQLLSGKVIKIQDGFAHIDVGLKSLGKVPLSEFTSEEINVGDEIDVVLVSIEKSDGSIGLSREEVKRSEVKKQIEQSFLNKEKVPGFAFASYKSGFKVNLSGVTAFLHRSQIDNRSSRGDIPLNTPMMFVVTSIDEDYKSISVSLREAKDMDKKTAKKEFIEAFQPGQVLENCLVKNIASYGAFIDIGGGHDGLLHITDMSWKRLHHPSQAGVEKGITLEKVVVLKVDKEAGHISLGIKQLNEDPWSIIVNKLKPGQMVDGIVTNIVEYGAFIELEGFNIEGLAHVSELSWESRNVVPTDVLHQNQKLKVQILAVDPEKRRVSLSVKNCIKNPWECDC
jgi:small subunit ribosomal protein S1